MTNQKNKRGFQTIDLAYIALAAVLMAVCSWISIPTVVPFTMQTFAVFFVLLFLGAKRGLTAIVVYLLLGIVGVPVFAEFTEGIGILLGNTGGYLVGFLFVGLIYWLAVAVLGKKLWVEAASLAIGMLVCYAFGTAWFMIVYARTSGAVGLLTALGWCVFPFMLPDAVKLGLALVLAKRLAAVIKLKK